MKITSVITVNYQQKEFTALFLESVKRFSDLSETEIIVVDNGSTEDQSAYYQDICPEVIYIRSDRNLGFAGGNNLGIQQASGKYLLLLNNDTEITAGFIPALVSVMEKHPEIGLLSPLILFDEDRSVIQYAGYTSMNYYTGRNQGMAAGEVDDGRFNTVTTYTGYCHGAAMMCRREEIARSGLMEEHYFLYYEELDWAEKFRRAGFQLGFTGKAKIYHKESMSVGKQSPLKAYFMARNRWLFIRRNAGWPERIIFAMYYVLLASPLKILAQLMKGQKELALATARGVWWNFRNAVDSRDLGYHIPDK
jgi:GT2 family glycosyltransferase